MNRLAATTIGAFSAVHTGFNRQEDTGIDGFLDLACEVNEAVEIIV